MKLYGYDWPHGGMKQLVYVDEQGHVIELEMGVGSPWGSADLTELTGVPPGLLPRMGNSLKLQLILAHEQPFEIPKRRPGQRQPQ